MIKKIFEYIKSNEYIFFSLYSSISLILVYFFYKLKLFRKFDDLRIVFLWYLMFFGIYGPYKKLKVKNYLVRFVISMFILIIAIMEFKL